MHLSDEITTIKGVGDKTKDGFYSLNIHSVDDLIHYYPRTYELFETIIPVKDVVINERNAVYGRVLKTPSVMKFSGKSILTAYIIDENNDILEIKYFNTVYLLKALKKDTFHVFRGYVKKVKERLMMSQPRMYSLDDYKKIENTIGPIYTVNKDITNSKIEKAVSFALENTVLEKDYLTFDECSQNDLMPINEALKYIHHPQSTDILKASRKRLVFDEFSDFLYLIRSRNQQRETKLNINPMIPTSDLKRLEESLPYELTGSQKQAIEDIVNDMTGSYLMNRLIQGDVGSGKTIVAFMALLLCASNNHQGVMMAPTDVLARQHFNSIKELTDKYKLCISPVLLVSKMSAKEKRDALSMIESGEANVVIGTHAVFQKNVSFADLKLIITDEQHRFGVNQRTLLRDKGNEPHILVMSATPIPRTLAMIIYADLDISIMKDMPKNRVAVSNCVVDDSFRTKAYDFILKEVKNNHQAYVICPMIDESESDNFNLKNVYDMTDELKEYFGPSVNVGTLHGKMKPDEKNRIMEEFKDHKTDVLVSTTVIEVGIDVANATVILIENAERFGLSSLHQLRGRVGRSNIPSYCILMSNDKSDETQKRLQIMNNSNDGFEIAREDMKLRGPGELSGVRQSGELSFAIGNIVEDSDIMLLCDKLFDSLKDRLSASALKHIDFRTI